MKATCCSSCRSRQLPSSAAFSSIGEQAYLAFGI
jgi:hypothetical protein